MPQAFLVVMEEESSRLEQSAQQTQTPLDQCDLCTREGRFLPATQKPFYPRDGLLHLDAHIAIRRFGAHTDSVEEAKCGIQSEAGMHRQDSIWEGEDPGLNDLCFPIQPATRSRLLHQISSIRIVERSQRMCNGFSQLACCLISAGRTLM